MNRTLVILIIFCLSSPFVFNQVLKTNHFYVEPVSSLPLTNSSNDIIVRNDTIWFGTDKGLSLTTSGGTAWTNFSGTATFDNKSISAIAIKDNTIWAATNYSTKFENDDIPVGGGMHYSTDHGINWSFIPQPVDSGTVDTLFYGSNRIRALAVTEPEQNITYDIALTKNTVWTANFAGMLRKSIDTGKTWQRVILPPDSLDYIDTSMALDLAFDLSPVAGNVVSTGNYNHRVFSVYAGNDSIIWAGTAGGINKSTDGGISWRKYSHRSNRISGNFVVALKEQVFSNHRIIWASTVNANDPDETKGVSFSDDAGETWRTTLLGEWAYNFGFKDSLVYVATNNGIYRSSDFGVSWIKSGSIYDQDPTSLHRFASPEIYCVGVKDDTVWCSGPEGVAYTIDSPFQPFGSFWKIFRTYQPIKTEERTYAYPNPFAPDDEPVRIHFSLGINHTGSQEVTIRIFDYAMQPVRTLIQKATRLNGNEYDEIWDGKNDNRSLVVNGVYFYRVEIGDQEPLWGKILVLK